MKKIVALLLIIVLAGCTGTKNDLTKPVKNVEKIERKKEAVTYTKSLPIKGAKVFLSNNKSYPGEWLYVKIVNDKPINQVLYGFLTKSEKSNVAPKGETWEDRILVPAFFYPGNQTLFFTILDNKNIPKQLSIELEIVIKPVCDIELDPSTRDVQNIVVKADKFKTISYVYVDGKQAQFEKEKDTFELETAVNEGDRIIAKDNYGLSQTFYLDHLDVNLYGARSAYDNEIRNNRYYLIKYIPCINKHLDISRIDVPMTNDDYVEKYVPFSREGGIPSNEEHYKITVLGLSPDIKYAIILSDYSITFDNFIDDKRKLDTLTCKSYFLYDIASNQYRKFSTYYKKYYKPLPSEGDTLIKEIGSYYYPVYWEKDKLHMYKIIKGDEFVAASDIKKYPNVISNDNWGLTQSLNSTAVGVSLDLNNATLTPDMEMKPVSNWFSISDQGLGVVAWTDIKNKYNVPCEISDSNIMHSDAIYVSDYKGNHVWNLFDVVEKQLDLKKMWLPITTAGAFRLNNDLYILLFLRYESGHGMYKLNISTGELSLVTDGKMFVDSKPCTFNSSSWIGNNINNKNSLIKLGLVSLKYIEQIYDQDDSGIIDDRLLVKSSTLDTGALFEYDGKELTFLTDYDQPRDMSSYGYIYQEEK